MKQSFIPKIHKPLSLALALLLIVSLAGCRKNNESDSTGGSDPLPSSAPAETTTAPIPTTTAPEPAPTQPTTEAPTEPEETEPTSGAVMGTITASELNIRKEPGTQYQSVGSYVKGDRVEILEFKGDWGRTDKGWISMDHVELDDPSQAPQTQEPDDQEITSNGNTTVKGYGVVTINTLNVRTGPGTKYDKSDEIKLGSRYAYYEKSGSWVRLQDGWVSTSYFYLEGTKGDGAGTGTVIDADLNVRSGPGKDYERVGGIKKGDSVEILAQVNSWGYTGKGWVSMRYVKMDGESTSDTVVGTGTVTASSLNIRKEPAEGAEKVGAYEKGDEIKILEIKNNWGRTDKGWVSMTYVKMDSTTGTVTASTLNIRKEPSEDAEKVGYYEKGDTVKILEEKDGWGRTDKGWISMDYVKKNS